MCTAKGSDGLRRFCVAGVGQCALPRGRMYALASLKAPPLLRGRRGTMCTAKGSDVRPGVPWGSAACAWQAWDNVHCQRGRMYALASLGAPPLLCGSRGKMCTAKGSDVRPGVPWGSAACAWQAWDNVHCQRGRMYALASLGAPPLLCGSRGKMCTAKGSDVRPGVPWGSASFAWQAWDNVHCQGVGCTPWRPLGLHRIGRTLTVTLLTHSLTESLYSLPHSLTHLLRTSTHSLTHSLTHPLTHSLTHSLTTIHSLQFTHLCMHIHTPYPKNSPTITPPSLLYFFFPSCFSVSLEKLVTCGVIRSYNVLLVTVGGTTLYGLIGKKGKMGMSKP